MDLFQVIYRGDKGNQGKTTTGKVFHFKQDCRNIRSANLKTGRLGSVLAGGFRACAWCSGGAA